MLAARAGRSRTATEELIWLDTADAALAAEGLTVEEAGRTGSGRLAGRDRRARQLVRTLPASGEVPLPGLPPGLARQTANAPTGVVPLAAFSGRRTLLPLSLDGQPAQATLRHGKLRAVAAERPVGQLQLTGADAAVLALARRLAETLPLLPATASLAEAGRALARGEAPRPRRRGAPVLDAEASVEAALTSAIGHLLETLLHQAGGCRLDAGPEGVHQARVALRRLRSVLKTFRAAARCPETAGVDAGLRDLARLLGPARDLDVFLAELGAELAMALPDDRRIAGLLRAAEARRAAAYAGLRTALDGPGFRLQILDGMALVLLRPWRVAAREDPEQAALLSEALPSFAARALDRRWHRLCSEGEDIAERPPEALHELRLEAKKLRYSADLFAGLWPGKAMRRFLRRLAALQEALGLANDATVAQGLVAGLGAGVSAWAVGAAAGFAAARSEKARERSLAAWTKLLAARPFWTVD